MGVKRAPKLLTDADIPAAIARDTETAAAVAAHVAAPNPHSQYLLQAEGDARYRQRAAALTDADIPAAIARDAEVTAAMVAHVAENEPHPSLWTRIANTFLRLTGGQQILRNNPVITPSSFINGNNHLELATNNGSNPILSFHKGGISATSLYHEGYGAKSLKIQNADGYNSELLHKVNHLDVTDPHAQYLLEAEGDARYLSAVKLKRFAGQTSAAKGQIVAIPHGLNISQIVSFSGVIQIYPNTWLPFNNLGAPDQSIAIDCNASNILVNDINTTWVNATNKPFRIVVFYEN